MSHRVFAAIFSVKRIRNHPFKERNQVLISTSRCLFVRQAMTFIDGGQYLIGLCALPVAQHPSTHSAFVYEFWLAIFG